MATCDSETGDIYFLDDSNILKMATYGFTDIPWKFAVENAHIDEFKVADHALIVKINSRKLNPENHESEAKLVTLNKKNGQIIWTLPLLKNKTGIRPNIQVYGETVYITPTNAIYGEHSHNKIYAFDVKTGNTRFARANP